MNNLELLQSEYKQQSIPQIKSDIDYNLASDTVAYLKRFIDKAETQRKAEVAPLVETKKQIDSKFKTFTNPLDEMVVKIKSLMVSYAKVQAEAQKQLELEAMANNVEDTLIIDNLDVTKSKGQVSSSSLTSTTKYRFKNENLNFIEIPITKMKEFLANNALPDFMESYIIENVTVRKNF